MSNIEKEWAENHARLTKALSKRDAKYHGDDSNEVFDPWSDVIKNIDGSYFEDADLMLIETLEAVRDRKTFEFVKKHGFIADFMLCVLSGNYLTDYGTSPTAGFPDHGIKDLWQELIDKCKIHYYFAWVAEDNNQCAHPEDAERFQKWLQDDN